MTEILTSKQIILILVFFERKQLYDIECRNLKSLGIVPLHKYYSYFNVFQKKKLFIDLKDKECLDIINTMGRYQWYGVAKQVGFSKAVQVETMKRYKKIDNNKQCTMTEEEARDFATSFYPTIGTDQLAIELADDNWKYDYTEITEISFDMDIIKQIQEQHSHLAEIIRIAVRR